MSYARRVSVTIETDSDGDAIGYLPSPTDLAKGDPYLTGKIITMIYTKDDYAAGVDFAITVESTGEPIWTQANQNASVVKAPRQANHATDGSASLYQTGSGPPVESYIVLAHERIKIGVDEGGDVLSGTFTAIIA